MRRQAFRLASPIIGAAALLRLRAMATRRRSTACSSSTRPAGYLDATVSYAVTPQATIVLEGANRLNTAEVRYLDQPERLRDLKLNDRPV